MATTIRELRARGIHGPARPFGVGELVPVFVMLWVVSVVRVVTAFSRHETFGAISTLALVSIVLLPSMLRAEVRR
ncbi:MAG TPA: hypothetical protein VH062_17895 [Polyangiaceae bacterium]|jgi:hypothetical protein|nr:hypothetical protein [Polyangiaceae bacterium]